MGLTSKGMRFVLLLGIILVLIGCGATHTAIRKRNLEVQTKMSATVFLDPVPFEKKTLFLQVRNTTDKPGLDLEQRIAMALAEKGYQLVAAPDQAHYLLQANILQVGKTDLRAAEQALTQGFGAALTGAVIGASLAAENEMPPVTSGLFGAAVATVTDAMIEDVVYSVITDIQISERVANSVDVKEKTQSKLKQGSHGVKVITSTEKVDWKRYQTRIVSTATKVNLKFEKALPELSTGLTRSIAGVF